MNRRELLQSLAGSIAASMVIEPTIDQLARVGSHSAISDEKNNIHWLRATTDTAFTYDVLIVDLNGAPPAFGSTGPSLERLAGASRQRVPAHLP